MRTLHRTRILVINVAVLPGHWQLYRYLRQAHELPLIQAQQYFVNTHKLHNQTRLGDPTLQVAGKFMDNLL